MDIKESKGDEKHKKWRRGLKKRVEYECVYICGTLNVLHGTLAVLRHPPAVSTDKVKH